MILPGTSPRHLHGRSSCFDLPLTFCLSSPRPRLHRVRISFLWLVSFPSGLGWQLTQSRMRDWESLGSWASGFCPWRDGTPKPTTNRGKGTLRKGNGEQKGGRGQSACSIQADCSAQPSMLEEPGLIRVSGSQWGWLLASSAPHWAFRCDTTESPRSTRHRQVPEVETIAAKDRR